MGNHKLKYRPWQIHVISWIVVVCAPLFILNGSMNMNVTFHDCLRFCTITASIIVVFYANYFFLIDRYLLQHRLWTFLGCNLLLTIGFSFIMQMLFDYGLSPEFNVPHDMPLNEFLPPPPMGPDAYLPPPGPRPIPFVAGNAILYALAIGIGVAIRMTQKWTLAEKARKEAEHIRLQSELRNLKNQINPHFLFNTLNNIYSFVSLNPKQAQRSIEELCRLLRYMLYDCSKATVTLDAEIDFLRDYVELVRIRLPQQTRLTVSLPDKPSRKPISPLLFISLFENAFKYGISSESASFVSIDLRESGNTLTCTIVNSYFPKNAVSDHSKSGIGLANLCQQLEILYPNHHKIACGQPDGVYRVELSIDLDGLAINPGTEIVDKCP